MHRLGLVSKSETPCVGDLAKGEEISRKIKPAKFSQDPSVFRNQAVEYLEPFRRFFQALVEFTDVTDLPPS